MDGCFTYSSNIGVVAPATVIKFKFTFTLIRLNFNYLGKDRGDSKKKQTLTFQ